MAAVAREDGRGYSQVVGGVDGVGGGAGAVADAVEDFRGHEGAVEEGCVGCCHFWLGAVSVCHL